MQLINSHNLFHRLELDGKTHTAIDTGIQAGGPALSRLQSRLRDSCLVLEDAGESGPMVIREATVFQILSIEKHIYIVLDEYFQGSSLQDYLLQAPGLDEKRIKAFTLLGRSLEKMDERFPSSLHPGHMLHFDGGILMLPAQWSGIISIQEGDRVTPASREELAYPDEAGYPAFKLRLYSYAGMLYRLVTGHGAVEPRDMEAMRRLKRKKLMRPLELYGKAGTLRRKGGSELADWISRCFAMEAADVSPALSFLQEPEEDSADQLPTDSRTVEIYKARLKRLDRFKSLRAQSGKIAIAAVGIAILIAILSGVIREQTRDLAVTGLEPSEVVELFFSSYNKLDHTSMEDAVHSDAASGEIRRILSLVAVSRVREGTEMRNVFLSAPEWLAIPEDERPQPPEVMVFGLTDLIIGSPEESFDLQDRRIISYPVSFSIWDAESPQNDTDPMVVRGRPYEGWVSLREFPRGWKIIGIEASEIN